MNDKLYNFLLKLPRKNLVHLMDEALDLMQQHNGRSKVFCIAQSIGCKTDEKNIYTLPSLKKAKENTEHCPLP